MLQQSLRTLPQAAARRSGGATCRCSFEHLQQAGMGTSPAPSILTLVPAAGMLPAPAPEPAAVNLDVTTLCAMVSEVCNSDAAHPDVQQWAARVTHWQVRCYFPRSVSHLPVDGSPLALPADHRLQAMFHFWVCMSKRHSSRMHQALHAAGLCGG